MKKVNYLLLLVTIIALFTASCGKDGAVGPQGSTGSTGPQGVVGPAGPAGANGQNGSVIYSGTTTPASTTGAVGDFYLDLSTGLLYGPKAASGWGTGFSLIGSQGAAGATGATGATGAAGNTVLSGMGMPPATLGNNGDYYLDKADYLLYGPKNAAGWGTAVSLRGPAGTANVEYSGWNLATNFRDSTFAPNYVTTTNFSIADLAAPALTQNLLDYGTYQVYFTDESGGVYPLPFDFNQGNAGNVYFVNYLPRLGHFIITESRSDDRTLIGLDPMIQYRYVLIPGGQSIGAARRVNLNDYEAVRRFYRIPD